MQEVKVQEVTRTLSSFNNNNKKMNAPSRNSISESRFHDVNQLLFEFGGQPFPEDSFDDKVLVGQDKGDHHGGDDNNNDGDGDQSGSQPQLQSQPQSKPQSPAIIPAMRSIQSMKSLSYLCALVHHELQAIRELKDLALFCDVVSFDNLAEKLQAPVRSDAALSYMLIKGWWCVLVRTTITNTLLCYQREYLAPDSLTLRSFFEQKLDPPVPYLDWLAREAFSVIEDVDTLIISPQPLQKAVRRYRGYVPEDNPKKLTLYLPHKRGSARGGYLEISDWCTCFQSAKSMPLNQSFNFVFDPKDQLVAISLHPPKRIEKIVNGS